MSDWAELRQRIDAWVEVGDEDRLQLVDLFYESHDHRETNPEYQLKLLTIGRNEARRLKEPWWVLFFESWRLTVMTSDLHDFASARPLVWELLAQLNSREWQDHSEAHSIRTNGLYTYLQVDPLGYRDELDQGFAALDGQITKEPVSERFVLSYRWTEYLVETQSWEAALESALRFRSLVQQGESSDWWNCWSLFLLCGTCHSLGRIDELATYAEEMTARSEDAHQLLRAHATGLVWSAVAHRIRGDEDSAARSFDRGTYFLEDLSSEHEICADALAAYHELKGDWNAVLGVHERELNAISGKGRLHRECIIHMERCRLLSRLGNLTEQDLAVTRESISRMLKPEWYLEKLKDLNRNSC
jgi:hypothetical protein